MPVSLQLRLRAFLLPLLLLLFAAGSAGSVRAADPTLSVSADRSQIYLHESFLLTLRVEGADRDIGEARFDAPGSATFELLGSSSDSRVFVQMTNGRTTRRESLARVLTYRVTPKESGAFAVRRASVDVAGKPVSAPGPLVRVTGIEPQEFLKVDLHASREAVLVEEPFQIVLSVTVRQLASPNAHHDPFLPNPPPKLDIPYLAQPIPKGLKGQEPTEILQPLLARSREPFGFAINDLTVRNDPFASPFSTGFDSILRPTAARFKLERDEVRWKDAPAWRYRLTVRYVPEREGAYTFGPALFKGQVMTGVGAGGTPVTQDIFAVGPAVTVRVVPPPEEGRPASFVGSVGTRLAATARLDTQVCKQGDPLLLSLDVTGDISLSNLRAPQLSLLDDFVKAFRSYDDAVRTETIPNGRRFIYTVRPLQSGTVEVPPIPLGYFDTEARAYRTVRTDPIPLRVEAVAQFNPEDIISTAPQTAAQQASIRLQSSRTTPAAITVNPEGAAPDGPLLAKTDALLLLPGPLLAALAALLRWIHRNRSQWRTKRRRRKAPRRAIRRVRRAQACSDLLRAIAGFFEDRFDLSAKGFAPIDAGEALRANNVTGASAESLLALTQQLFDQSFHPDAQDSALLERARLELPGLLVRCTTETPAPNLP